MMRSVAFGLLMLVLAGAVASCGAVRERKQITTPPAYEQAQTASLEQLLELVNVRYAGIESKTVSRFDVEFTGGSIEQGYLEKYRKAKGYLVAERPSSIFVNILNPLTSSSVLVMASRQGQFQIWIPSRNQFVVGSTDIPPDEENAIYNVRPTHILQGILWEPIPQNDPQVRFSLEQEQDLHFKYYVISIFEFDPVSPVLNLLRKIWIERSQMQVRRQQYYSGTELTSSIEYGPAIAIDGHLVSTRVDITRPVEGYSIRFDIDPNGVRLDRPIKPDAFVLESPPGAELIQVESNSESK